MFLALVSGCCRCWSKSLGFCADCSFFWVSLVHVIGFWGAASGVGVVVNILWVLEVF
jgi:hypothetical protein